MGERASAKQYLIVDEDGKGHLPVRDSPDGPLNHRLMGAAWAALHGGYRGNKYEGPGKEAAIAKLKGLYKSAGMEPPGEGEAAERKVGALADGPRFLMTLAEPPATGRIRIPIAVTGKWNGAEEEFSIGLDDLNDIRENFAKKPTGEINVDYEHASEVPFGTGGPVLSAGRIVKLDEPEPFENGTPKIETAATPRFALGDSHRRSAIGNSSCGAGMSPPSGRGSLSAPGSIATSLRPSVGAPKTR